LVVLAFLFVFVVGNVLADAVQRGRRLRGEPS
jgi:hypothetical protein